jgi:hypothetical protein
MKNWFYISGMIWFTAGSFLLYKGVSFTEGLLLYAIAIPLGYLKGRYVLSKTVGRMMRRMASLEGPITLRNVYPLSYWFLIAGMISLGVLCSFLPNQVRGFVDLTIGSALVYGAFLYFRAPLISEEIK